MNYATIQSHQTIPPDDVTMDSYDSTNEDEEVDQLDSDSEKEAPVQESIVSTGRTRPKPLSERVPGRSLIPHGRLENILELEMESSHVSKEAVFLLSIATEEFIKRLASASQRQASITKRATVTYRDVASVPLQHQEFMFLQDTIPAPIPLSEAFQRRAVKEKEPLEDDATTAPPTAPPTPVPPLIATLYPIPVAPPAVYHHRHLLPPPQNHVPEPSTSISANGSASTGGGRKQRKTKQTVSANGESSNTSEGPPRRRSARNSRTAAEPPVAQEHPPQQHINGDYSDSNGQISYYQASTSQLQQPQQPNPSPDQWVTVMGPVAPSPLDRIPPDDRWPPAHFTGPASAYLENHRIIYSGRGPVPLNPGRAIYSKDSPPNR
ncbi:hypothetical protein ABKN59_002642 [Abortiporus biennis]